MASIGGVSLAPPLWPGSSTQPPQNIYCQGHCSSAFYNVPYGSNNVVIGGTSYGLLGPFAYGLHYAVNIRDNGCAELWTLTNTSVPFNQNTSKTFVTDNGSCSNAGAVIGPQAGTAPIAQVVNNQGSGTFTSASIGNISLPPPLWPGSITQPPQYVYCQGGCSSAFFDVAGGTNSITIGGISYGTLGVFAYGLQYAVNISNNGCAELWLLTDLSTPFNQNTSKTFVSNNGNCSGGGTAKGTGSGK